MMRLTISAENAEFQIIQALKVNRSKRTKLGEIFIEGIESIKQALAAGLEITRIITHDYGGLSQWAKDVIADQAHVHQGRATLISMAYPLYKQLCDREDPTELLVTARVPSFELNDLALSPKPFVVVFDRPSDHGNFGSILRTANSFGVDAILVIGHGIDWYEPKVIRSSMGAVFFTKVVQVPSMAAFHDWINIQKEANGMIVVGTDSSGEVALGSTVLQRPVSIILGNEAKGMSIVIQELCDVVIKIPLQGQVNSLNVSCAGSIILWEVFKTGA